MNTDKQSILSLYDMCAELTGTLSVLCMALEATGSSLQVGSQVRNTLDKSNTLLSTVREKYINE